MERAFEIASLSFLTLVAVLIGATILWAFGWPFGSCLIASAYFIAVIFPAALNVFSVFRDALRPVERVASGLRAAALVPAVTALVGMAVADAAVTYGSLAAAMTLFAISWIADGIAFRQGNAELRAKTARDAEWRRGLRGFRG